MNTKQDYPMYCQETKNLNCCDISLYLIVCNLLRNANHVNNNDINNSKK